jgi:hypothetical protein
MYMAFQPARFTHNPFTRGRRALLPPIFTLTRHSASKIPKSEILNPKSQGGFFL